MRRIRLTGEEQAQLAQLFKTTEDRRLRDRCQAVLMAYRGQKRKTIAQDLGVHRTTVRLWLKHYQKQGITGSLNLSHFVARKIWRRRDVSSHRCRAHRL